jgi:hypothetical protein
LPGTKRRRRVSNERNRPKRLLRASLDRPYRGSPKKPNEVAAFHCVLGIFARARNYSKTDRAKPLASQAPSPNRFLSHHPPNREGRQRVNRVVLTVQRLLVSTPGNGHRRRDRHISNVPTLEMAKVAANKSRPKAALQLPDDRTSNEANCWL